WVEYVLAWREVPKRYPEVPTLLVPSEALFRDPRGWFDKIARFAGLDGEIVLNEAAKKNEFNPKGSQRYPLGELWRAYRRHPEVLELAEYLGYRLEDVELAEKMQRYQPPDSALYRLLFAMRW